MSRYIRKHILQTGAIVDSTQINDELNVAVTPFNGGLDANNFDNAAFTIAKLKSRNIHDLTTHYNPWSGSVLLDTTEVNSRGWTFFPEVTFNFTANDEGVLVGAWSGVVKKYAQTIALSEMGWAVGVFLDGRMIARTELTTVQLLAIELPFSAPIDKGSHTLRFALRGLSFASSVSGTNVFNVDPPMLWWMVWKR